MSICRTQLSLLRSSTSLLVQRTTSISPLSSISSSLYHIPISSYHERVIDHYENPRNVGSLDSNDHHVGTGLVGAPACGDVMKLQLLIDDNGVITDAKFKTFGCGSAIASSSLATTLAKGKNIDQVLSIKNSHIAKHLNLPPVKLHCSMLAEDAIKAAVKDYQRKQSIIKEKQQENNNNNTTITNNIDTNNNTQQTIKEGKQISQGQ